MRKIKEVFALLAAVLTLTTAALAAEPGDALVPVGEAVAISLRCDGVVVSALADIASEARAVRRGRRAYRRAIRSLR